MMSKISSVSIPDNSNDYAVAFLPQVVWIMRGVLLAYVLGQLFFSWAYGAMMRRNSLNVDKFTKSEPTMRDRAFVAFTHW